MLGLYSPHIELVVRKEDSTSNRRLSSLNFNLSLSLTHTHYLGTAQAYVEHETSLSIGRAEVRYPGDRRVRNFSTIQSTVDAYVVCMLILCFAKIT